MIRIVVCEDHAPLRRQLVMALEQDPDLVVVAEAADSGRAVRVCRDHAPDCVLVGIGLAPVGGPATVELVRSAAPTAAVVMVGTDAHELEAFAALKAGATGFVNRDGLHLGPAVVRAVSSGVVALPPLLARLMLDDLRLGGGPVAPADERACEVLEQLAGGRTYTAAAEVLDLTPATAKNLVTNAAERLVRRSG